jgi:hypothetical protein
MRLRLKMNEKEIKLISDYVKKRYDEVDMDYKTFNGDIDTELTYLEQKRLIDEKLLTLLPAVVPKKRKECSMPEQQAKEELAKMMRAEQEKQEKEIKDRLDKEIELITKDSQELGRLYHIPIRYIEMVANKEQRGLLLYGESSLGKSYRVKEVLNRLKIKDYFFVSGHITPMKFYEKLYRARNELVIFDDVNILDNLIILNMIKASLNENSGNVVEYHTTKKMEIPSSFVFNGQVIMLLNDIPKRNEHLKAIESRVLKYHLKFSREEILKIIFEIAHKKEIDGTTLADRLEVAKWIRDTTNRATQNLNIRLYLQAINFFKFDRENWKVLAGNQIQTDEYANLIIQNCGEKDFIEKTGLSRRTFYRYKEKLALFGTMNITGIANINGEKCQSATI